MTLKVALALSFTFVLSGCSDAQTKKPDSDLVNKEDYHIIRVLTYNIKHGHRANGKIDMDLLAEIINEQKPDLVALQEIDKFVNRSGEIDIIAELGKRTGLHGFFGKYRNYKEGEYGAGILSGFPVENFTTVPAYTSPKGSFRTYNFAKVKIAKDEYIYFSSIHLQHKFPKDRFIQAGELLNYYKTTLKESPLILAGDFNATPNSEEMKLMFEHFAEVDESFKNTFSARSQLTRKIDYILYPKNNKWKVFETKVICRNDASDHCAVFAVLGIKKRR